MEFASPIPKLRIERAFGWDHHRFGWGFMNRLFRDGYSGLRGTLFVGAVEDQLHYFGAIQEPWIGVLHQVPETDLPGFPDLKRFLAMPAWADSRPYCLGLWTLCEYTRDFLISAEIGVPVEAIPYVAPGNLLRFSWDRFDSNAKPRLLHVGEFLRDYQAFFDLEVPDWSKEMLRPEDWPKRRKTIRANDGVRILEPVPGDSYDKLISESVIYLKLFDAPANTTVIECLACGTPICINEIGGVTEYLGSDYPLYHGTDPAKRLADRKRLEAAHQYLLERYPQVTSTESFHAALRASAIYAALPDPQGMV